MKYRTLLFWMVVWGVLTGFLQGEYRFHFYYMEQMQLFLWSGSYARETLWQPGGLALYLGRFLVQFFILPGAGALLVAGLLTCVGYLMQRILKKVAPDKEGIWGALLPVLALLIMHWDFNYMVQGTVAYLMMLGGLLFYVSVSKDKVRMLVGLGLLSAVFLLAGAVAALLACLMVAWEVWKRSSGKAYGLLYIAEVGLMAWGAVWYGWAGEYRFVLLPDAYCDPFLRLHKAYYAWGAIVISVGISWCIRNREVSSPVYRKIQRGLLATGLLFLFYQAWNRYGNRELRQVEELDYYARTEQWEKIVENYSDETANRYTTNLLNMALARLGMLGERMFHYRQEGRQTLIMEWGSGVFGAVPLCDIHYYIGDMPTAQKYAFEGYVATLHGGNTRLLKRLVETNLVMGAYTVAEKYIRLMEATLFYRQEAERYRNFLYNDRLVEQDRELGNKRKGWKNVPATVYPDNWENILEQIAVANPSDQTAIHYLAALYLSSRQLSKYKRLIETYYGTKVWPALPVNFQEAVVLLSPDNPAYWVQHGVSLAVEQRYGAFRQDLIEKRNYMNFEDIMSKSYGDTYWHYLIFKK